MPSPCAVARSCSLATGAKTLTRSLTSWAAIRKPHATPYTPSTRRGSRRRFSQAPSIRTPFIGPSRVESRLRPCGSYCTARRGSSAGTPASGLWRWRHRLPSRRDSSKGRSRERPSGQRLRAFSEFDGCEPNAGSPLLTPCTKEKKAARPTDGGGRCQPRMGSGFLRRVLVEPGGPAHLEHLERARKAPSPHPAVGRQRRPRAESRLLLRALPARDRPDVDKVRGR